MVNKKDLVSFFSLLKQVFVKYRSDRANVIVAAISFYVLLTFIPFVLLSASIIGYIIELSDLDEHFIAFISTVLPLSPHHTGILWVQKQLNLIALAKNLSGPLGIFFLFFFTSKLFSVLIPAFHIIFKKQPDSFMRGKGKELVFTLFFTLIQTVLFGLTILTIVAQAHLIESFSDHSFMRGMLPLSWLLDTIVAFAMFWLLYSLLSPAPKYRWLSFKATLLATALWVLGKVFFKYYMVNVVRLHLVFGVYGMFLGLLFWIYYSVFILVVCAELQAILRKRGQGRASVRRT